jgi:hypothetical protein
MLMMTGSRPAGLRDFLKHTCLSLLPAPLVVTGRSLVATAADDLFAVAVCSSEASFVGLGHTTVLADEVFMHRHIITLGAGRNRCLGEISLHGTRLAGLRRFRPGKFEPVRPAGKK